MYILYNIYPNMRYVVHYGRTRSLWIIQCHRCLYTHTSENINCERVTEGAHYCIVLLIQHYGLGLVNMCSLEF